jgi:DNA-directed RNA polymerase subunit RPC12/RpoP
VGASATAHTVDGQQSSVAPNGFVVRVVLQDMFDRVLAWLGRGTDDDPAADLDWTDADAEYGGDGPTRSYTCPECGATVEGVGPDQQVTCPDCATAFRGVLVPDHAICPDCTARIENFAFYPATRRDSEYAACGACGYRWESDPRA